MVYQSPGNTMTCSTGLSGNTAAQDLYLDINVSQNTGGLQGKHDEIDEILSAEVFERVTAVDLDEART
jgi:hypothetical protein